VTGENLLKGLDWVIDEVGSRLYFASTATWNKDVEKKDLGALADVQDVKVGLQEELEAKASERREERT
jgi:hypothetical protein